MIAVRLRYINNVCNLAFQSRRKELILIFSFLFLVFVTKILKKKTKIINVRRLFISSVMQG